MGRLPDCLYDRLQIDILWNRRRSLAIDELLVYWSGGCSHKVNRENYSILPLGIKEIVIPSNCILGINRKQCGIQVVSIDLPFFFSNGRIVITDRICPNSIMIMPPATDLALDYEGFFYAGTLNRIESSSSFD